jgi:hypothetical protein
MNPTPRDVHIDSFLTNFSVGYIQRQANYIASQVFPMRPVDKMSDRYFKFQRSDWFRDEAAPRAPATESVGSGYRYGKDRYECTVFAFHKDVDDQTRANADNPIDPDREATEFVTQRMLMRLERDWATSFMNASVWTAPPSGTLWNWDDAASLPWNGSEGIRSQMVGTTGFEPNTLVMGYGAWSLLKFHPALRAVTAYTGSTANIRQTQQAVADLFEVDRVFISRAIYNKASEIVSDTLLSDEAADPDAEDPGTFDYIFPKNAALFCYVTPNPGPQEPTAGYTFAWRGVSDGAGLTVGTTRFRMPELRADRVESQMAWDFKVVAKDMGYYVPDVTVTST